MRWLDLCCYLVDSEQFSNDQIVFAGQNKNSEIDRANGILPVGY